MNEDPVSRQRLLSQAVSRVGEGLLPQTASGPMYAGPAREGRCSLCDIPFTTGDVEYEIVAEDPHVSGHEVRLHFFCFQVWKDACDRVGQHR